MKIRKIIALALCAMLACSVFAGCDDGKIVDGNLVIELDGNPTTGYTWVYQMSAEGVIEEISNTFNVHDGSEGMVGAGGTFRFEFAPVAPGNVGIQFSYLRTFQENSTVAVRTFAVTVDENLTMTLYDVDKDTVSSSTSSTDASVSVETPEAAVPVIAGDTFIESVVFGETTEDVVFTWTLCNSGIYIGVDEAHFQWSYFDGADHFISNYISDEELTVGTEMTVRRYTDSDLSAQKLAKKLTEDNPLFTDFSSFDAELDGKNACGVSCSNPDTGISATYYFVQIDKDVVEIAVFYEGAAADNFGPRLDAMVGTVIFTDTVSIIE